MCCRLAKIPTSQSVKPLGNCTAFRKTCSIPQAAVLFTLRTILALVETGLLCCLG